MITKITAFCFSSRAHERREKGEEIQPFFFITSQSHRSRIINPEQPCVYTEHNTICIKMSASTVNYEIIYIKPGEIASAARHLLACHYGSERNGFILSQQLAGKENATSSLIQSSTSNMFCSIKSYWAPTMANSASITGTMPPEQEDGTSKWQWS